MKKIIGVLIVFSFLFINEKALAMLLTGCGVYPVCNISTMGASICKKVAVDYFNCKKEEEAAKQKEIEKERLELEIKRKIYNERNNVLSQYSDFFVKVGVNLVLDTSEEEYNQWLSKLKIEKADYLQKQEDKQKMEELEKRIKELEAQKNEVKEEIIPVAEVIVSVDKKENAKPIIENKPAQKTIIKKEELKKEMIEKVSPVIDNIVPVQTSVNKEQKPTVFKKVINWFKSLI